MKKFLVLFLVFQFFTSLLYPEKIPVIFETDMGNDIDDALALAILYKYMDEGKIVLLAVVSNKDSEYSPEFINIMNTWYGYPNIPVGVVKNGVKQKLIPTDYTRALSLLKNDQNEFVFPRNNVIKYEDAVSLYRRILSEQPDNSVVVISVGFSTNLSKLLASEPDNFSKLNGKKLVKDKVKMLSMMGGNFNGDSIKEYNIVNDINAARNIFLNWDSPIIVSPIELGIKILYPAYSIMNDFNWTKYHPLADGYKIFKKMPYNRPTWDLTSVLYAVENYRDFFNLSKSGKVTVHNDGITTFKNTMCGKHKILNITQLQKEKIEKKFIEIISKKSKNEFTYPSN